LSISSSSCTLSSNFFLFKKSERAVLRSIFSV
jgi:hypothetical protein